MSEIALTLAAMGTPLLKVVVLQSLLSRGREI